MAAIPDLWTRTSGGPNAVIRSTHSAAEHVPQALPRRAHSSKLNAATLAPRSNRSSAAYRKS